MTQRCDCGGTRVYVGTYAFPRATAPRHHFACERLEAGRNHEGAWAEQELDTDELAEWWQSQATEALRLAFVGQTE